MTARTAIIRCLVLTQRSLNGAMPPRPVRVSPSPAPRCFASRFSSPQADMEFDAEFDNGPMPRNEDIPFDLVHFVTEETRGLPRAQPLRSVLALIDRSREFVELVNARPPIVKIISIKDAQRAEQEERARSTQHRKRSRGEKEVQVTWTAAEGDLNNKMKSAQRHLSNGDRVNLVFAPRSGRYKGFDQAKKAEIIGMFDDGLEEFGQKMSEDADTPRVVSVIWHPKEGVATQKQAKKAEASQVARMEKLKKKERQKEKSEQARLEGEKRKKERQAMGGVFGTPLPEDEL